MTARTLIAAAVIGAFSLTAQSGALAAGESKEKASAGSGKQSPGATSAEGRQNSSRAAGKEAAGSASANAPVIVLVPVAVARGPEFGNGCWANLYDGTDFRGNRLSLVGPVDMANMRTAFGTDWSGEFDSVEVGPKATLVVYDNENYRQKAATFKPGQKVRDLDEKLGLFEDIRSVKISCAGGAGTAQGKPSASAGK